MHAEYTIRALKAGKHVLCEKPMANTAADCEKMIAAAKAANKKLMVAYRCRYEPNNQLAIKMAQDSSEAGMGPTRVILAEMGFNIGNPGQWRLKKAMAGGGSMMDIGIYALNAARYLTGEEPNEVYAMISSTPNDVRFAEVEENITFQLRFPSGILANCVSSYGTNFNKFRVCKPRGAFELDPATPYTGLRMRVFRGGAIEDRSLPQRDHFQLEMDHFSECIQTEQGAAHARRGRPQGHADRRSDLRVRPHRQADQAGLIDPRACHAVGSGSPDPASTAHDASISGYIPTSVAPSAIAGADGAAPPGRQRQHHHSDTTRPAALSASGIHAAGAGRSAATRRADGGAEPGRRHGVAEARGERGVERRLLLEQLGARRARGDVRVQRRRHPAATPRRPAAVR